MAYPCRDSREHSSIRKGTAVQSLNLGLQLQLWIIVLYMMISGIRGTSSMKPCWVAGIRQVTAWFLVQRIREGFMAGIDKPLTDQVNAEESAVGSKRMDLSNRQRNELVETERGSVGKAIVGSKRDRESKQVSMAAIEPTSAKPLRKFVIDRIEPNATVYTGAATAYGGIFRQRESLNNGTGDYVAREVEMSYMEAIWCLLERGSRRTCHYLADKQIYRHAAKSTGRNYFRGTNTPNRTAFLFRAFVGRRPSYAELVA